MLVVACFSGCGEPLSKDKKYDVEIFDTVEVWHTYGDLKNLRAGTYEVLIPECKNDEIISISPGFLLVKERYHSPLSTSLIDGTIFTEITVYFSSGEQATPI